MAVVNCRECGKPVSTEAAACPHCGAPQKAAAVSAPAAKPKKKLGLLGWIGVVLVTLFVIGLFAPSKKGVSADASGGAQAVAEAPAAAPAIAVTARALFDQYQANEVSADQQFKGKRLKVTGTVDSINKDFTNDIYVMLATPNPFMGIHASLDEKHQNLAASLGKGQRITLTCIGGGMVIGSPMLRKCEP